MQSRVAALLPYSQRMKVGRYCLLSHCPAPQNKPTKRHCANSISSTGFMQAGYFVERASKYTTGSHIHPHPHPHKNPGFPSLPIETFDGGTAGSTAFLLEAAANNSAATSVVSLTHHTPLHWIPNCKGLPNFVDLLDQTTLSLWLFLVP